MSAPLARALADSAEFSEFLMAARARDRGELCATADECAGGFGDADGTPRHGWDRHMAPRGRGISYQMADATRLHAALVHLPERLDPAVFHKESFATEPKATETLPARSSCTR